MEKESSTAGADDLKLVYGIGPKTERRLHESGVLTYAQLAGMSPTELAELLHDFAGMSATRIEEQGWISQARDLAPEQASAGQGAEEAPGNGQHYATFRIELLLDEENEVRRTRIDHIQGEKERNWAGWDSNRLVGFIVQQASLEPRQTAVARDERGAEARQRPQPSRPRPLPATMHSSLDLSEQYTLRAQPVRTKRLALVQAEEAPAPHRRPARLAREGATPIGAAPIARMRVIPEGEREPSRVVHHDRPFSAHLTLENPERLRRGEPLDYTASLFARAPGEPHAQPVGESRGILSPGQADIDVGGRIVSPGTYRLEAQLTIGGAIRLSTTLRGGFVHVY